MENVNRRAVSITRSNNTDDCTKLFLHIRDRQNILAASRIHLIQEENNFILVCESK